MKRFAASSAVALGLVAFAIYSVMSWWGPDYQWRQKLTVTVETPGGLKTGSAVTEVSVFHNRFFKDGAEWQTRIRGEAVVVALNEGNYLFALLGTERAPQFMNRLAQEVIFGQNTPRTGKEMYERIEATQDVMIVPQSLYPVFVTFDDLNDPTSVRELAMGRPDSTSANKYEIQEVTLQIVDEGITVSQIARILSWAPELWPRNLDGSAHHSMNASNRLANSIGVGSFSTEIGK
jgi:hypothetical protein